MEILFIILLFVDSLLALAVLGLAIILLKHYRSNAIYFNFGMANLFMFFWMFVVILNYLGITPSKLAMQLSYCAGILLAHFFFLFTYYFPFQKKINEKIILSITYIVTGIIAAMSFVSPLVISSYVDFPYVYHKASPLYLSIYISYFFLLALIGLGNLYHGWKKSVTYKEQSRKVFVGIALMATVNLIISLGIFYFIEFNLTLFGMLSVLLFTVYAYHILYPEYLEKPKTLKIKSRA